MYSQKLMYTFVLLELANPMAPHHQIVHKTAVPSALAVDWIGKNLYWCDVEKKTMEVSKANGLYPTVLISAGLKNPTDMVLDPQSG